MSALDLAIATEAQAERLWPAVRAAHLFGDRYGWLEFRETAPWRVRVDEKGRAAVLERWRPHLDYLAIRALWVTERDIPGALMCLQGVARAQGFGRLLSPLLAEENANSYRRWGMEPCARVVALRASTVDAASASVARPQGAGLRPASADDLPALLEVDEACFEPFWAFGEARLAEVVAQERVTAAESSGEVIGYTLCTVERGSGTLGRLGVAPHARGRGVGASLLADALRHMARSGALCISLCTQEENAVSRSLYARFGFRELPGRLELLSCDV